MKLAGYCLPNESSIPFLLSFHLCHRCIFECQMHISIILKRTPSWIYWTCERLQLSFRHFIRTVYQVATNGIAETTAVSLIPVAESTHHIRLPSPTSSLTSKPTLLALLLVRGNAIEGTPPWTNSGIGFDHFFWLVHISIKIQLSSMILKCLNIRLVIIWI